MLSRGYFGRRSVPLARISAQPFLLSRTWPRRLSEMSTQSPVRPVRSAQSADASPPSLSLFISAKPCPVPPDFPTLAIAATVRCSFSRDLRSSQENLEKAPRRAVLALARSRIPWAGTHHRIVRPTVTRAKETRYNSRAHARTAKPSFGSELKNVINGADLLIG